MPRSESVQRQAKRPGKGLKLPRTHRNLSRLTRCLMHDDLAAVIRDNNETEIRHFYRHRGGCLTVLDPDEEASFWNDLKTATGRFL